MGHNVSMGRLCDFEVGHFATGRSETEECTFSKSG
ncbi:uncharacterized protein SOCE26_064490 [Sorangium cellulosum]|uniref:Uncharacterized protein n=1 Tax=Sorangium cellulosum TaxID=56 RepID=A0A2L0F0H7_SORCE|nr:uncharacterized protein SOCE26_064490 [Sorangium cellulosum]